MAVDLPQIVLEEGSARRSKIDAFIANPVNSVWGQDNKYNFSYDVFPQTLNDEQMGGHVMKFTAYTGATLGTGAIGGAGGGSQAYSALLYIPGGGDSGASSLNYEDTHEYVDVKLTQPITSNMLGIANAMGIARRAINPAVQVIYRSTNLRDFVYSFLLTPTSEQEARSMYSIVHNMRKFAAPELTEQGLLFISPAEWEISFWFNGQENTTIPRIKRCALQKITADYASQGSWSSFSDGSPVSCLLTVWFREMEIIHRGYVEDGF